MKKSRFSEQQIAFVLRQAEEGTAVAEVCRRRLRLRRGELCLGLVDLGQIGRLLDLVEEVAGFHLLTLCERYLVEEPVDPGAQLHCINRPDAPNEIVRPGHATDFG